MSLPSIFVEYILLNSKGLIMWTGNSPQSSMTAKQFCPSFWRSWIQQEFWKRWQPNLTIPVFGHTFELCSRQKIVTQLKPCSGVHYMKWNNGICHHYEHTVFLLKQAADAIYIRWQKCAIPGIFCDISNIAPVNPIILGPQKCWPR